MKYAVINENVTTEFVDLQSAQDYAVSIGLSPAVVVEVPNDSVPDFSSSIEFYEQKVREGYPIPNTSYSLALGEEDRLQFASMLTLINELLYAGHITIDTPQTIKDKNDNIVTLTTEEFKSTMIGYGMYYKTIWNNCTPVS